MLPVLVGLGLGTLNLIVHAFTGYARILADAAGVPAINVPFPESLLFYSGGAIVIESLYRLILITVPLWLISTVVLRKRGQTQVFWILAVLTSLLEPADVMSIVSGNLRPDAGDGRTGLAMNLFEAHLFRRHGFLAPLAFRLSYYLIWHVVGSLFGL